VRVISARKTHLVYTDRTLSKRRQRCTDVYVQLDENRVKSDNISNGGLQDDGDGGGISIDGKEAKRKSA
jgi:hypothetical protein